MLMIVAIRTYGGNPGTIIEYEIANYKYSQNNNSTNQSMSYSNDSFVSVQLRVYDILGREVATLVNEQQTAGYYEVTFGAASLTSEIYFYSLTTADYSEIRKMLLIR